MEATKVLETLSECISEAGYTQEEVAKKIGISQGHMSHILKGIKPLNLKRFLMLLELLGIDLQLLTEGRESMTDSKYPFLVRKLTSKLSKLDEIELARVDSYIDGFSANKFDMLPDGKKNSASGR